MKLVEIGTNCLPVKTWEPAKDAPNREFAYIDISSVSQDHKAINSVSYMPGSKAPSRARQLVQTNDILVSTVRPNLNSIAQVAAELDGATASTGFSVLRADGQKLYSRYLYNWVRTKFFVSEMVRQATGQSYPAVSDKVIRQSTIPLPTIEEQRRIAAILDQADALSRLRKRALDRLDTLGQSIFYDMFGDPLINSKRLKVTTLGDVARLGSGGTPSKTRAEYWHGSLPWVSPKDMKRLEIFDAQDYISESVFSETSLKKVPAGTPLIVVRGMILAHTVPIGISRRELAINQDMKSVLFDSRIVPEFGFWCLRAQEKSILKRVSTAAHGTKRLDGSALKSLPTLVPSIDVQNVFVSRVDSCRRLSFYQATQSEKMKRVFESLQHRAFRGEL